MEVSSIGTFAERSEIPSDCSRERSAKWFVLVACEARQVEDDDELDAALVRAAVLQEPWMGVNPNNRLTLSTQPSRKC